MKSDQRQHPLRWQKTAGLLADALGLDSAETQQCEALVQQAEREQWTVRRLFEEVGQLELTDETWANFLYTYGWWSRG